MCFAAQWALFLHHVAKDSNIRPAMLMARLLVPLIALAEVCSWYAVLTTAYIGNAIEESLWALSGSLLIIGLLACGRRAAPSVRPMLLATVVLGAAYVAYMCIVDVPMYVARWLADEANGRTYLTLRQGLWDVSSRWIVTHAWDQWHPEIPWMSLYFSVGVWSSLALVHVSWLTTESRRAFPNRQQSYSLNSPSR